MAEKNRVLIGVVGIVGLLFFQNCGTSFRGSSSDGMPLGAFPMVSEVQSVAVQAVGPVRYRVVEELILPRRNSVGFIGMKAGVYHPQKLVTWNRYAFNSVIEGGSRQAPLEAGNVYASSLVRTGGDKTQLFYGGWDFSLHSDKSDRTFTATSSNFLSRPHASRFDFSPPVWTQRAISLTDNKGMVTNDPSIQKLNYSGVDNYFAHYSIASNNGYYTVKKIDPVTRLAVYENHHYTENYIGWAITDADNLGVGWYPSNKPLGLENMIAVGETRGPITYLQRPSIVYDSVSKYFYLYFDQGGIDRDPQTQHRHCRYPASGPNPIYPGRPADGTLNDCDNHGFNIHVAVSQDGKNFWYAGHALKTAQWHAAPEVKKFSNGWIMFSDSKLRELSYSTSLDGKNFSNEKVAAINPLNRGTITNVHALSDGDSLRGVLFGEFPPVNSAPAGPCAREYTVVDSGVEFCIQKGRINAYFLQKKAVFRGDDGSVWQENFALDEDRLELGTAFDPARGKVESSGTLTIYDTDGSTILHSERLTLKLGHMYSLVQTN